MPRSSSPNALRPAPASHDVLDMKLQLQSPLFKLPPELRNRIYEMVLGVEEDSNNFLESYGKNGHRLSSNLDVPVPISFAFLRTCQRVHSESIGILEAYWDKDFYINLTDSSSCTRAVGVLYTTNMKHCLHRISNLTFNLNSDNLHLKMKMHKVFSDYPDYNYEFSFTNNSSFSEARIQAAVDRKCRQELSEWLEREFDDTVFRHEPVIVDEITAVLVTWVSLILVDMGACYNTIVRRLQY